MITNNIEIDGIRIDLHLLGIRKSEPARKEIEEIFGLVKTEGRKIKNNLYTANCKPQSRIQITNYLRLKEYK